MKPHIKLLKDLEVCEEAVDFAAGFPSLTAAWKSCKRGDWMLWYAGKVSGPSESNSRNKLVLAACACARTALKFVPKNEHRPLKAIETAEAWAKGRPGVSLKDVRSAAADSAAYVDAADAAAAHAADAAAHATYAATYAAAYAADAATHAAAHTAAHATYAAAHATYAATYAHAAAVRRETLAKCADIVRGFYPTPPRRVK